MSSRADRDKSYFNKIEQDDETYSALYESQVQELGRNDPVTLKTARILGNIKVKRGDWHGLMAGEGMLRMALEGFEKLGPAYDHETLATRIDLANLLMMQTFYEEAEYMYKKVLESQKKIMRPNDPEFLKTVDDLARAHEAVKLSEQYPDPRYSWSYGTGSRGGKKFRKTKKFKKSKKSKKSRKTKKSKKYKK